jgi:hypothetical protein
LANSKVSRKQNWNGAFGRFLPVYIGSVAAPCQKQQSAICGHAIAFHHPELAAKVLIHGA